MYLGFRVVLGVLVYARADSIQGSMLGHMNTDKMHMNAPEYRLIRIDYILARTNTYSCIPTHTDTLVHNHTY